MINKERLIATFLELVMIDSPSGDEEKVTLFLEKILWPLGFTTVRDTHGNLIASNGGVDPLVLSAHMDTVEPGRGIAPRIIGSRIISDGTTILGGDCKAGIAAILEALQSLDEDNIHPIPLEVVFTRGEEIGLMGAKNLEFPRLHGHQAIVFDGNGPVTKVTSASPTYMRFDLEVTGRAAHAGVEPEKGLSAIKILAEIVSTLPQGRLDSETTINVGTISGGSVRNTVPDKASFTGEFRSRNTETIDLLKLEINEILSAARERYRDAIIEEDIRMEFQMYQLDLDDPMIIKVKEALTKIGLKPEIEPSGGGTDANIFNLNNIQSVVVGMSTQDMHTTREFVEIADLVDTARFCDTLIRKDPAD